MHGVTALSNINLVDAIRRHTHNGEMETKQCSRCRVNKTVDSFHRNAKAKDGLQYACVKCIKTYSQSERGRASVGRASKRYQSRHPETIKAWKASEAGIDSRRRAEKKHRDTGKPKARHAAHGFLKYAVTKGVMPHISTHKCKECGVQADHYHHHNGYEKEHWLDVIPLCFACHNKAHGKKTHG